MRLISSIAKVRIDRTGTGAGIGILLGGAAVLSIPGVGPATAAGSLIAILCGAAAGGLLGALVGAEWGEFDALVPVRADDVDVARRRRAARAL